MRTIEATDVAKVSADTHVNERHDFWCSRLPAELREKAPHQIESNEDGGWRLVVNGEFEEAANVQKSLDAQTRLAMREHMMEEWICLMWGIDYPYGEGTYPNRTWFLID